MPAAARPRGHRPRSRLGRLGEQRGPAARRSARAPPSDHLHIGGRDVLERRRGADDAAGVSLAGPMSTPTSQRRATQRPQVVTPSIRSRSMTRGRTSRSTSVRIEAGRASARYVVTRGRPALCAPRARGSDRLHARPVNRPGSANSAPEAASQGKVLNELNLCHGSPNLRQFILGAVDGKPGAV